MAALTWEEAVDEGGTQNTDCSKKDSVFFFLFGMLTSPPAIMEQIRLSLSIA